jgi:hypothetical protein
MRSFLEPQTAWPRSSRTGHSVGRRMGALGPTHRKLATKPWPTGSMMVVNTIGTVRVACSRPRHWGWSLRESNDA